MSQSPFSTLASQTLRQLRQIASELGITLYSRKTKDELLEAISARSEASDLNLASIEAEMAPAQRPVSETRVVFLPRDPQWAYVFWDIAEQDRARAFAAGTPQLCLRVADVTGLAGGSAHPHTLQEVVVDTHASEWYLPVPLSDRDYRVELGFRKSGSGWISLAFSSVARVPALHPSEQILDQFVPFSLEPGQAPITADLSSSGSDSGLHERLYQSATSGWRRLGRGSEAFHEIDQAALAGEGQEALQAGVLPQPIAALGGVDGSREAQLLQGPRQSVADPQLGAFAADGPREAKPGRMVPLRKRHQGERLPGLGWVGRQGRFSHGRRLNDAAARRWRGSHPAGFRRSR